MSGGALPPGGSKVRGVLIGVGSFRHVGDHLESGRRLTIKRYDPVPGAGLDEEQPLSGQPAEPRVEKEEPHGVP